MTKLQYFLLGVFTTFIVASSHDDLECKSKTTVEQPKDSCHTCIGDHKSDLLDNTDSRSCNSTKQDVISKQPPYFRDLSECTFALAESAIPNAGYGMFALKYVAKGTPVLPPSPAIALVDIEQKHGESRIAQLIHDYSWKAAKLGMLAEGLSTAYGLVPGTGTMSNTGPTATTNVAALSHITSSPSGVLRNKHAAAGSFTHYHNQSFVTTRDVLIGQEILLEYGSEWKRNHPSISSQSDKNSFQAPTRDIEWLNKNAYCLESWKSVDEAFNTKGLRIGRGALSTRAIAKNTIIAPVPVFVLERDSLELPDPPYHQLLLNYCLGHVDSSVLLFPYHSLISLLNHDSNNPNAKIIWQNPPNLDQPSAKSTINKTYVLELVALRDIAPDEMLTIDYGNDWVRAWERHESNFASTKLTGSGGVDREASYAYASKANYLAANKTIRTWQEQVQKPYPSNLQTGCLVDETVRKEIISKQIQKKANQVIAVEYKQSIQTNHVQNLYPCAILERPPPTDHQNQQQQQQYTVQVYNHNNMLASPLILESIHSGGDEDLRVILTKVPRHAIRFIDVPGTSDAYLANSFRHEIGFDDFPKAWIGM